MSTPASVGINNDLSSCETSVALGSANNESARGLQMVDGVIIQVVFGNHGFHNLCANNKFLLLLSFSYYFVHYLVQLQFKRGGVEVTTQKTTGHSLEYQGQ